MEVSMDMMLEPKLDLFIAKISPPLHEVILDAITI